MYIAVDIGGTKTLVAVFDEEGVVVREERHETDLDLPTFLSNLSEEVARLSENQPITAIAIAAPGVVDPESRLLLRCGNLPWVNAELRQPLVMRFNCPVLIDNDGNMGALGEACLGAGQSYRSVLYLTVSTGIGSGVAYNGQLVPVFAKTEAGMMVFEHQGQRMIWEKFASGHAFAERYDGLGRDIEDPAVWEEFANDLSVGFNCLLPVVQPDVVVVGGSMGDHLHKYHDQLVAKLREVASPLVPIPPIVEAHDSDRAVIYGCFVACRDHVGTT